MTRKSLSNETICAEPQNMGKVLMGLGEGSLGGGVGWTGSC